ncbi:N-acetyltransferase [Phocicoccus schoeneichii]|uniref:N-acetyltransferase domain-containing protein n=1 Tax=Phocicoccus schoeneichii TaxID=1812261 RepID=A0A6V7RMJ0_9BACL|nr:GNAT family N-acetyltransferase [Jeotgalicoccus schoeneichii]GGH55517.1 N-acetyltransferase [Jeotgalicoccus schoeneichii]CAD2079606.1 hypothetical protein JEOSCH030_01669 [Jeotgalicoccus schoeneichii]
MNITYHENRIIDTKELIELYKSVEWSGYYEDTYIMEYILKNSLFHISAWDGEKLVGLVRVVGDVVYIAYIQDILVHPDYQRHGIGKALMEMTLERVRKCRQIVLTTENSEKTKGFYKSLGFKEFSELGALGFGYYN